MEPYLHTSYFTSLWPFIVSVLGGGIGAIIIGRNALRSTPYNEKEEKDTNTQE